MRMPALAAASSALAHPTRCGRPPISQRPSRSAAAPRPSTLPPGAPVPGDDCVMGHSLPAANPPRASTHQCICDFRAPAQIAQEVALLRWLSTRCTPFTSGSATAEPCRETGRRPHVGKPARQRIHRNPGRPASRRGAHRSPRSLSAPPSARSRRFPARVGSRELVRLVPSSRGPPRSRPASLTHRRSTMRECFP